MKGFYSDYLYHIWRCTSIDLSQWNCVDNIGRNYDTTGQASRASSDCHIDELHLHNILFTDHTDRREIGNLSLQDFITDYLIPNKPVVITVVFTQWPAFKYWSKEQLIEKYGDKKFYINSGVWMTLRDFFKYCTEVKEVCNTSLNAGTNYSFVKEMPMYLFDHYYGENCPSLLDDYFIPEIFEEDFFKLLGK